MTAVEFSVQSNKMLIIGLYRTAHGDFETLLDVLDKLFCLLSGLTNTKIIVAGDWNIDFMVESSNKALLNQILEPAGFRNLVNFPTRIEKKAKTSIDFVITNIPNYDIQIEPIAAGIADHDAQIACIKIQNNATPKYIVVEKRVYDKRKVEEFGEAMLSYDWDKIFEEYNINTFDNFMSKVVWNLNLYFPIQTRRIKKRIRSPWVCDELVKLQNDIHDLYHIQRQYPQVFSDTNIIEKKIIYREILTKKKKKEYIENRIKKSKNTKKEIWSVIKEETNRDHKEWIWDITDNTTKTKLENYQIPDYLNDFFISIGKDLCANNPPDCRIAMILLRAAIPEQPELTFPKISTNELIKLAQQKINHSGTKDVYDISGNFLFQIMPYLVDHITFLVNNILASHEYPKSLKKSRLSPLYKGKGDTASVSNYRPITIVPTMSKIIESIISNNIMNHLNKHNIISECQHAYRSSRSTTTATLKVIEAVMDGLEKKKKVAAVFIDLSKAFDSINHELLLQKLWVYGIRSTNQELIKSFLADREQIVGIKIDQKTLTSGIQITNTGIPQGSSLGNILFLVFINDIAKIRIPGEIVQYADDTTIVLSADTIDNLKVKIIDTMRLLSEWFQINGLKLNTEKTNLMFFNAVSSDQEPISVLLQDDSMCTSSNLVRLLGFEIDPALKWKQQIDVTCKKMGKGIYALKQLKAITTSENLKEIYYAYVHSILSYGIILWGRSTDYERVLKMQKRAIRVLVGGKFDDTCRAHFKELGILTSVSVYILEVLKFVRKNIHKCKIKTVNSKRTIRNNKILLETTYPRLKLTEKLPIIVGQTLFNKLPEFIKSIKNEVQFSNTVKMLLLDRSIYTFNEFYENDYSHLEPMY